MLSRKIHAPEGRFIGRTRLNSDTIKQVEPVTTCLLLLLFLQMKRRLHGPGLSLRAGPSGPLLRRVGDSNPDHRGTGQHLPDQGELPPTYHRGGNLQPVRNLLQKPAQKIRMVIENSHNFPNKIHTSSFRSITQGHGVLPVSHLPRAERQG